MKTSFFPIGFLLVVGALIPLVANAALTWETKLLDLTAMAGTPEIATSFSFRNDGATSVTISGLRTSCDCTTAETDQRVYRPGESGRIEVRFHPGERTGLAERIITVTTANQSDIMMRLRVNLFEPVSCSPQILTWRKGDSPSEQTVQIAAIPPAVIRTIDLGDNDLKKFARVRVDAIEAAKRYRLSIVPLDRDKVRTIPLRCRIEFTDGSSRRLIILTDIK